MSKAAEQYLADQQRALGSSPPNRSPGTPFAIHQLQRPRSASTSIVGKMDSGTHSVESILPRGRPLFTKHPSQRAMHPFSDPDDEESLDAQAISDAQMLFKKRQAEKEEELRLVHMASSRELLLKKYNDAGCQTITFNVGGTFFVTTVTTLLREPNTLFITILDREESSIKSNKNIFLDRNPKYFSVILDFMRTASFCREDNLAILRGVLTEAEFFKIKTLIKMLKDLPELSRVEVLQMVNSTKQPVKLRGMWLKNLNLSGFDLSYAILDFGNFTFSNFRNSLLFTASMSNAMFDHVNLSFAVLESANLNSSSFMSANLRNCNMRSIVATHTNFSKADLSNSCLAGADLSGCNLAEANLVGCDLTDAILTNADLRGALFSEDTIMAHAHKQGADFEGSNVTIATKYKTGTFRGFLKKNRDKDKDKDIPKTLA